VGVLPAIAVLTHEHDDFEHAPYLLRHVAAWWRAEGGRFDVVRGLGRGVSPRDYDAAIQHVDLTRIPDDYVGFASEFRRVVNGRVRDISKRAVSAHQVRPGDGYAGPVIVKTNLNCGGLKEAQLAKRSFARRVAWALRRRLPWTLRPELGGKGYRVFDSAADVPWPVWRNPALIVERFAPEFREGLYWVRNWLFLGGRDILQVVSATAPIVARPHITGWRFVPPDIPVEVRAHVRSLGVEFAKADFTVRPDGAVLFDINRTPTHRMLSDADRRTVGKRLGQALARLVDGEAAPPGPVQSGSSMAMRR